jgi:hypothetical protein
MTLSSDNESWHSFDVKGRSKGVTMRAEKVQIVQEIKGLMDRPFFISLSKA